MPSSRGTSKDSMPRTNSSSTVDRIAGRSSGMVTRVATCQLRAPDTTAASSMRMSSTRKAGPISR